MSTTRCPGPCHAELTTGRSCRTGECLKDPSPQMRAIFERMKELAKDVIFVTPRSQGKSVAIDTEIYNPLFSSNHPGAKLTLTCSKPRALQSQNYVITDFSKIDLSLDS